MSQPKRVWHHGSQGPLFLAYHEHERLHSESMYSPQQARKNSTSWRCVLHCTSNNRTDTTSTGAHSAKKKNWKGVLALQQTEQMAISQSNALAARHFVVAIDCFHACTHTDNFPGSSSELGVMLWASAHLGWLLMSLDSHHLCDSRNQSTACCVACMHGQVLTLMKPCNSAYLVEINLQGFQRLTVSTLFSHLFSASVSTSTSGWVH